MERQADGRMAVRIADDFPLQPGRKLATIVSHYDTANRQWIYALKGEVYYPVDVQQIGLQLITSPTFLTPPAYPNGSGSLTDGMPVCVRHYGYEGGGFINFHGRGNADLTFENIEIFQCPGHTFVGYGCDRGFRIANCRIGRRNGSNLLVSATADGAHFGATEGDIIIENCDFSYMGDDAINIHSTWYEVVRQTDARTFEITSRWFGASARMDPGDELKLCRKDNLAEFGRARIATSHLDLEKKGAVLTVDADLPDGINIGDFVGNITRSSARFVIRNNFFHDHRARGILLQARNGLVEKNHVRNVMGSGFQLTTDCHFWKEGYGCENLILRDNLLEGCNHVGWERGPKGRHMACISLIAESPSGLCDAVVHRNVILERNTVRDTPGLAVLIASSQGVVLKDNLFVDSNTEPFEGTGEGIDAKADGAIMITRSRDVAVTGNKLANSWQTFSKAIYVDARNTKNIVVEDNIGFD